MDWDKETENCIIRVSLFSLVVTILEKEKRELKKEYEKFIALDVRDFRSAEGVFFNM